MADVPLQVISDNSSSERRITPSWSISQLKSKLELVTGVPPSSQRLSLQTANKVVIPIEAADEDNVYLTSFPLSAYAELHVRFYKYLPRLQFPDSRLGRINTHSDSRHLIYIRSPRSSHHNRC